MNWVGLVIAAAGLFSVAGGACDWDWYMNHRKARFMCAIMGRTGTRIFYVLLGLFIAVVGLLMAVGVVQD